MLIEWLSDLGWVLWSFVCLMLVFSILVVVHEYGHFYVARLFGVKVLRFSVGFGKVIWSRKDSQGTEFAISMLPLGGYVSMLGELPEADEDWSEDIKASSLTQKSPWQRMAIAFAGPFANILLAVVAYWLLHVIGMTTAAPYAGEMDVDSPASRAGIGNGHRIVAVDGTETPTWLAMNLALSERLGDTGVLTISTIRHANAEPEAYKIPVVRWLSDEDELDPIADLGFDYTKPPAVLGVIEPESPADVAGLQRYDQVLSVDDELVTTWQQWVELVRAAPNRALSVRIRRGGTELLVGLTPVMNAQGDAGYVGVYRPVVQVRRNVIQAIPQAVQDTLQMSLITLGFIKKMLVGLISSSNIGGPLTIADVAGKATFKGIEPFLYLLALLSITLAVLNLLPIPILDGGAIFLCMLEILRGKPVPMVLQVIGIQVGTVLIVGIMLLAIFNDFNRFIYDIGKIFGG